MAQWTGVQRDYTSPIRRATDAGLQCAIHAIGDRTVQQAIDCLSQIPDLRSRRHRIEHLEITTPKTRKGLAIRIVASVQPAHLDPATFDGWPEMLGIQRCKRAFAYQEFVDAGAHLSLGPMPHCGAPRIAQSLRCYYSEIVYSPPCKIRLAVSRRPVRAIAAGLV
ncbi:hypothetical protein PDIDSM_2702 [Penicillium digitatum]|nr:hypothetical protein PDIDSM_2702 [Penicillium digitatum]